MVVILVGLALLSLGLLVSGKGDSGILAFIAGSHAALDLRNITRWAMVATSAAWSRSRARIERKRLGW